MGQVFILVDCRSQDCDDHHMRYLLILFSLLAIGCGSQEPEVAWQTVELGTDAGFRDIFFLDASKGWMVGEVGLAAPGGIVARTRDGGLTWQYRTKVIPTRRATHSIGMNAVHFLDELNGVIAAESGTIMRTEDGGDTWQKVPPTGPIYASHRDIDFVDERNGWIVGRMGVLRTEDGGASWERVDENLDMAGESLDMLDVLNGWMVGKFGLVLHTVDGGVTWEKIPALGNLEGLSGDEKPHLRSVHFIDEDHGWAAGSWSEMPQFEQFHWGVIIHTRDGGETWQHQIEGLESYLTAIRFADRKTGWAVGYNRKRGQSQILVTEDGGNNWAIMKTIEGEELKTLEIRDGHVWTVGDRTRPGKQALFRLTLPVVEPVLLEGIGQGE